MAAGWVDWEKKVDINPQDLYSQDPEALLGLKKVLPLHQEAAVGQV